jgi:hypothetical protein
MLPCGTGRMRLTSVIPSSEHLLGDQHPVFVELSADLVRPAEDRNVDQQHNGEDAEGHGQHRGG